MNTGTRAAIRDEAMACPPWWRHPMVWLVLAGPAAVVVAGLWTVWIAVSHPDPVVGDTVRSTGVQDASQWPAQQARNHAVTPQP